jgi:ActR/RegA family two-component response regulator
MQTVNVTSTRPSLLIVDDDSLIREGLSMALADDFDVYQAESRISAITLLRSLPGGGPPCRIARTKASNSL